MMGYYGNIVWTHESVCGESGRFRDACLILVQLLNVNLGVTLHMYT